MDDNMNVTNPHTARILVLARALAEVVARESKNGGINEWDETSTLLQELVRARFAEVNWHGGLSKS
jgi:hypothetical protein